MIKALGYDVEYTPWAFGDEATYQDIMSAVRFMQFPGNCKPALGVSLTQIPKPDVLGSQQHIKLFVVVEKSDDSLADVSAFLARFENIYVGAPRRTLNLQFRTIK